jgi:hypothetical protein
VRWLRRKLSRNKVCLGLVSIKDRFLRKAVKGNVLVKFDQCQEHVQRKNAKSERLQRRLEKYHLTLHMVQIEMKAQRGIILIAM